MRTHTHTMRTYCMVAPAAV